MRSLKEIEVKLETTRIYSDGEDNDFSRRLYHAAKCSIPRRYFIAVMLFFVFAIEEWKNMNIISLITHFLIADNVHIHYYALSNWTIEEVHDYFIASSIGSIFVQFPGALLIFITSSHKFLSASIALSAILHLITFVAVDHHSVLLVVVLVAQRVLAAPVPTAVLSMWKEWAPPAERTKLMAIPIAGSFIFYASSLPLSLLLYDEKHERIRISFYMSGACGLIWSLLWYVMVADTPSEDPRISENELLYLQNNIPSTLKETTKLSQVPWKCILTSKHVYALFPVYYMAGSSILLICLIPHLLMYHVNYTLNMSIILMAVWILLYVVFLVGGVITADFLIKKFRGHVTVIRKSFLCGSYSVSAVLFFPTLFVPLAFRMVAFCLGHIVLAFSVAGLCTVALDLSSRYISILGGLIGTFYAFGDFMINYMEQKLPILSEPDSLKWIFLHEIIVAILAAGIFFRWGSTEEQPWSFNIAYGRRSTDYQSYPEPEGDDLKLETDDV